MFNILRSLTGLDGEDSLKVLGRENQRDQGNFDEYSDEEDDEDIDDFIVDAQGQSIHSKKVKRKAIYTDA